MKEIIPDATSANVEILKLRDGIMQRMGKVLTDHQNSLKKKMEAAIAASSIPKSLHGTLNPFLMARAPQTAVVDHDKGVVGISDLKHYVGRELNLDAEAAKKLFEYVIDVEVTKDFAFLESFFTCKPKYLELFDPMLVPREVMNAICKWCDMHGLTLYLTDFSEKHFKKSMSVRHRLLRWAATTCVTQLQTSR